MLNRRHFLQQAGLLAGSLVLPAGISCAQDIASPAADLSCSMPDEGERHAATWMAFGAPALIWGERLSQAARQHLAGIARAIAAFEPVKMLVAPQDYRQAAALCGVRVELVEQAVDDLWLRDTGPLFTRSSSGQWYGADFNFNGWGNKQTHGKDAMVARAICQRLAVPRLKSSLVLEGGGIEVDGAGTAIITESCVLNPNRNPGVSKAACEAELKRVLGIRKVIWLPGVAGRDITDGHTDFYARFVRPGVVVAGLDSDPSSYDHAVTQRHLKLLRQASDAAGRKLEVIVLPGPDSIRPRFENHDFAAGYVNFYLCNGAVIAPQFGDQSADANCRDILREQFPGREIVQLDIDAIAAGGGGIHCTTQQQPAW